MLGRSWLLGTCLLAALTLTPCPSPIAMREGSATSSKVPGLQLVSKAAHLLPRTGEGRGEGKRSGDPGALWVAVRVFPRVGLTLRFQHTCTAPPRTWHDLSTLLANPSIATPAATTDGQTLPEGIPASVNEANEIDLLVAHWLACQNAGEPLRAWSLFSDGYLYRLLSRQGALTEDGYMALATPAPSVSEPATLREITSHRRLPDGRLGASVEIAYPSVPMPKRFFFYFTERNGRLVIDGILGEISFAVP